MIANPAYIEKVCEMAAESINKVLKESGSDETKTEQARVVTNVLNCEGAILYQILFQVFKGEQILIPYIPKIIEVVVIRMRGEGEMKPYLKHHLFLVILSALYYNAEHTFTALANFQVDAPFFNDLATQIPTMKNNYQKKSLVLTLTAMLSTSTVLPPYMAQIIPGLLANLVDILVSIQTAEAKAMKKHFKKDINMDEDDDDYEDYDDENDDDDDEDDEELKVGDNNDPDKKVDLLDDDDDDEDDDLDNVVSHYSPYFILV